MGSLKTLAVAGAVVLGAATYANAGDLPPPPPPGPVFDAPLRGTVSGGLYLRGDVGVGVGRVGKYSDPEITAVDPTVAWLGAKHPTPFFIGAGVGYKFNNWFRADVTGEYRAKAAIGVTDSWTDVGGARSRNIYNGSLSSFVLMANAYVDLGTFCAFGCLTPYLGAGVGIASNSITGWGDQGLRETGAGTGVFAPTGAYARDKTTTSLAWALHAGLGYQVNERLTLELGYRYLNLGKAQSGNFTNVVLPGVSGGTRMSSIDSHDIRLGMRWALNGDCCGVPAPAPVFAPPPPMVRKY